MIIHIKDVSEGNLIETFIAKISELGISEYVSVEPFNDGHSVSFGIENTVSLPFVGISEPSLDFWDVLSTGSPMSSEEVEAVLVAIVPTENDGKSCPSGGCGGCSGC